MTNGYHIVVCGSIVPDPLQTLEPVETPTGPALKNEINASRRTRSLGGSCFV